MARVKALFFLPVKDNDGRPLAAEIDDVEDELNDRFAGWTMLGYFKGSYRMVDGRRVLDVNAAYTVIFEEDRIDELVEVLRQFRGKTMQETIYLEIQRNLEIRFVT